jgi:dCMP deaminase
MLNSSRDRTQTISRGSRKQAWSSRICCFFPSTSFPIGMIVPIVRSNVLFLRFAAVPPLTSCESSICCPTITACAPPLDFAMLSRPLPMNPWDHRFFEMCTLLGSWSEDRSRQVGCVIVGKANEIRATGFNGLPRGVNGAVDARHSREGGEKYQWFEHAERNAIYNAARIGVPLEGCRLYVGLHPCADCARAIIQVGVASVHTFAPPLSDPVYSRSFEIAQTMLSEAGIELRYYDQEQAAIRVQI